MSLRKYMAFWAAAVSALLLVLSGGWFFSRYQLSRLEQKSLTDSRGVDVGRLMELAILGERREDLLWRDTGDPAHKKNGRSELRTAESLLPSLREFADTPEERRTADKISSGFARFKRQATAAKPVPLQQQVALASELIYDVNEYENESNLELQGTVAEIDRIYYQVSWWFAGLVTAVFLTLVALMIGLIRRIVGPTFALTRAARRFGEGRFDTRLTPARDDEMGRLMQTFNDMADDIAEHERARMRFVGTVAHDLRNPIVGIGMAVRLLERKAARDADERKWLEMINASAKRLDSISKDLMDNVQIAAGKLTLRRENVDLAEVASGLLPECRLVFEEHTIVTERDARCPVFADRDRLERVLFNLVSNAAKYSPAGGVIRIDVHPEGGRGILTVSDNGPGIPPDELAVVFQPFGRGEHAHQLAKGAGLGLFVVKQIIEAHQGKVEIESAVGKGTTVRIIIPLSET